jgi:rare lipoprotein A
MGLTFPVRKLAGAAALMMTLTLAASARDRLTADPGVGARTASQSASTAKGRPQSPSKARRWLEVGVASWYGSQFQGRKTAGGEPFDMNQMTCAHPTLPMGTWLRVTNLKNRRTAFVRVNDRGPVIDGRIVDLSFAAARTLGLAGIGKVRLESVRAGDPELDRALVAQLQLPVLLDPLVP